MSFEDQAGYVRAKLVCGACGRVLDRLFCDPADPVAISSWATSPAPTHGPASSLPSVRVEKPSVHRSHYSLREYHPGPRSKAGQQRYECHRRCGAVYVIRLEQLTTAVLAGRPQIIAGVDV